MSKFLDRGNFFCTDGGKRDATWWAIISSCSETRVGDYRVLNFASGRLRISRSCHVVVGPRIC